LAWSPDSTAVAFASGTFFSLLDSDIYIFDLATSRLANLTDDAYEGDIIELPLGVPYDDTPAWSPDSQQIAFSRLVRHPEGPRESIMRIDRVGGEAIETVPLGLIWPMAVEDPMAWLPGETLLYTQMNILEQDLPDNGLWRANPAGQAEHSNAGPQLQVPGGPDADVPHPVLYDVHPQRGVASLYSRNRHGSPALGSADPAYWVFDLADASLTPLPPLRIGGRAAAPASPAVFSPDGAMILMVYVAGETTHLVLLDLPTRKHQVLDHPELEGSSLIMVTPEWSANDTVHLRTRSMDSDVVIHLERAPGATPVAGDDFAS
jgi:hypothetical protein